MFDITTASQAHPETVTRVIPVEPITPTFLTSPEDTPGRELETPWDENIRQIKNLLSQNQYKEAVLFGVKVRHERCTAHDTHSVYSTIARAEFDMHYAKALFYTGATEKAITVLKKAITEMECGRAPQDVACQSGSHPFESWRRNWVLGQAHNHLGYTYWMNQGHYRLALRELHAALPYFAASGLREEYANACDNMGRVYASLYQRDQAEILMDNSIELRFELEPDYRVALSLNSRAIAHLIFGEPQQAHRLSTEALSICERLCIQRGIGLACITQGRVLRYSGGSDNIPHEKRITFLEQAAMYLSRAIGIFEQHVCEPVRLVEAYNELGCTYRDWAELVRHKDPDSQLVEQYYVLAVQHLRTAIKLAEKEKHTLLCADSCEDLARTYFQSRQFKAAEGWLRYAEDIIPDPYKIVKGSGLPDIPIEECIEGFWWQMGKIERLRGDLASACGASSDGEVSHKVRAQATQHYAFATAYSKQYSEQAVETRTIFQQIQSRFQ